MTPSRIRLPLAVFTLLTGLCVSPALQAQTETLRTAIFSNATGAVTYTGNFRHFAAADGAMTHGYLALSLAPTGKVTGTLTWHGTTVQVPLKGKLDLTTGAGHFSERDAAGNKLADALRIPFLVSKYGLTLNGGGMAGDGESTSFFLSKHSDGSGNSGDAGGGVLTLGGATDTGASNTYTGASNINAGGTISITGVLSLGSGSGTVTSGGTTIGAFNGVIAGSSDLYFTGSGTLPTVVAGNLTWDGGILLRGPITIKTGPSGSIVYTGKNSSGTTTTVTVLVASAATGG